MSISNPKGPRFPAPELRIPSAVKKNIHIIRMLDEDRQAYRSRILMMRKNGKNFVSYRTLVAAEVVEYINVLERRIRNIRE